MLYEQKQGATVNIIAMKIYLAELLLMLLRRKEESEAVDADSRRAERLKKYIETNYFEKMDSNTISQKLGISTRHGHTIFKNYYDTTPMKYLNEVRLEAAKLLLEETNKDIATICFRSEEHTSELQSRFDLVCRLLFEKRNVNAYIIIS